VELELVAPAPQANPGQHKAALHQKLPSFLFGWDRGVVVVEEMIILCVQNPLASPMCRF
jgi:hypothetical protein